MAIPVAFEKFETTKKDGGKALVDMNNPKHVVDYKGEKVYYCCDGCKVKFDKEPEKYMKKEKV